MVYVLSDIHGNQRRFDSILEQIDLQPEDTLYVLGDVIDRHPDGLRILRRIMAMPNAKMILGNHEYMMLRALGQPYDNEVTNEWVRMYATDHWYRNGGKVTHDHWKHLRKTLRAEITEYLLNLPLNINITVHGRRYKLVHGAPVEAYDYDPKYKDAIHFAVWKRLGLEDRADGYYTMIFGHTPTKYYQDNIPMEIWRGDHRIGIDCGSGYPEEPENPNSKYGRLACLRLDDGAVFYSKEGSL